MKTGDHVEIPRSHGDAEMNGFEAVALAAEREFAVLTQEFQEKRINGAQLVMFAFMHGILWGAEEENAEAVGRYVEYVEKERYAAGWSRGDTS